jgi:hypothetical protein
MLRRRPSFRVGVSVATSHIVGGLEHSADADAVDRREDLRVERDLRIEHRAHGVMRAREPITERVADRFEDVPAMGADGLLRDRIMPTQRVSHRDRVTFSAARSALMVVIRANLGC